ncbi:hypothetical protein B0T20DRAFT_35684 [Sordaria brevicollis]|uniref:Uncharacterized protein n=1 Tax=Sordaria brevicollis TaxID=83679 RepID=A0AAE0P8S6_SORBR|nr:hypothetical protein B0T20DRAFT_35684 [Sordaria brevicollis]
MTRDLQIKILSPSEHGANWVIEEKSVDISALINLVHPELGDLPDHSYIFIHKNDYPPVSGGREALLAAFNVPGFVASRTCFELNGYAGCRPVFDETTPLQTPSREEQQNNTSPTLTSCTTWFRYLVKMVGKIDSFQSEHRPHDNEPEYVRATSKKGYEWFEMSVFTRWDSSSLTGPGGRGKCRVLCIDTPPDCPERLRDALAKKKTRSLSETAQAQAKADPFALHADLLDIMITYSDISVWRVRDPIRLLEKSRLNGHDLFEQIHDHARHAYHSSEVLEAAIQTVEQLGRYQREIHDHVANGQSQQQPSRGLTLTYRSQAQDYTQFQISLVKSLKLRSDSSLQRLKNEVGLAYNNIARQDNSVMKSIALLTMIFLPATFISALFSTTFFTYGDNGNWEVSDDLWIYWVTTIPTTIAVVVFWRVWLDYGDVIYKWSKGLVLEMWNGLTGPVMPRRMTRNMGAGSGIEKDVEDADIAPSGLRTAATTF